MESSSEDSFLWTDASSDNCDDLMAEVKRKNSGVKSPSCDHQLQENISTSNQNDTSSNYRLQEVGVKEENCNTVNNKNKRKIKLEPESEVDMPKKKKKVKHYDINDNQDNSEKSISYDNSYLDRKVKKEMFGVPALQASKIKKKRVDSESQLNEATESPPLMINIKSISKFNKNGDQGLEDGDSEQNSYTKLKKKKKKSKKIHNSSDEHTDDNVIVEDKFTAEETVVGQRQKLKTETYLTSPNKNHSIRSNHTFQEDSEGSCDEISAIKGDEDHNLHSTLFTNKGIEDETKKRKSTNSDHAKYKPRTQRISDRIQFEDEEDLTHTIDMNNCTDKPYNKKPSKVNHHLITNTYLKPLTQHLNSSSIITKNDDLWLLKCPKDIDISAFKDINLKIGGKYKIKISGQSYDSFAKEEDSGSLTVLSMENHQYQLKNIPLSGTINLRKRIPKPHFQDDNVILNNQTNFIPLPETKCRHPLFGSNYKKALKIPSAIAERLNAQDNLQFPKNIIVHPKKKKKHKKDNSLNVDPESHTQITEDSLKLQLSTEIKEKKKKRKLVIEQECSAPKKQRIKCDPESVEAWESEKTIEENLFNF